MTTKIWRKTKQQKTRMSTCQFLKGNKSNLYINYAHNKNKSLSIIFKQSSKRNKKKIAGAKK